VLKNIAMVGLGILLGVSTTAHLNRTPAHRVAEGTITEITTDKVYFTCEDGNVYSYNESVNPKALGDRVTIYFETRETPKVEDDIILDYWS
jgi:hypothetical protein